MKIGIISLGLIGGSLFKKLCQNGFDVCAVTGNEDTIQKAKKYSACVSSDKNLLKGCDIVFVASPIALVPRMLDELENIVSENCIVLDCASVKGFITKTKRPYKFIGSHPMAGTEFSGFDASFPELFEGAKWVLTPDKDMADCDIETAKNIIEATGAEIIITTPEAHDKAVALISHMPLLLSQALFHAACNDNLAMKLASSGFRDMTRLAMSNLKMAEDMRYYNAENIDFALDKLHNSINILKNAKVPEIFADIKNIRSGMYSKEGKNLN